MYTTSVYLRATSGKAGVLTIHRHQPLACRRELHNRLLQGWGICGVEIMLKFCAMSAVELNSSLQ